MTLPDSIAERSGPGRVRSRLRLPGHSFKGFDEFQQFRKNDRPLLDNRRLFEEALATPADSVVIDGTCGVCLHPAQFVAQTAYGEAANGGRIPNWREGLRCDCEHRLISRERAVLHFLRAHVGLQRWMRILAFGEIGPLLAPLATEAAEAAVVPQMQPGPRVDGHRLPAASARYHIAVSLDTLQHVPPLPTALAEIARVLSPGGCFVFTIPFHPDAAKTSSSAALSRAGAAMPAESPDAVHQIGWDVLDMLRAAGFIDTTAFLYWSEELGYMGARNFIFCAVK